MKWKNDFLFFKTETGALRRESFKVLIEVNEDADEDENMLSSSGAASDSESLSESDCC